MDVFTLDQIQIFLAIVDEGSFSKAARKLNRAQSAITYGIQKLETQIDMPLFDRAAYRPTLTEAGRSLLLRARRIVEETKAFQDSARSLASGLEPELTVVLDSMFPMSVLVTALKAFTEKFPTVPPRVYVQPLGAATELVLDGTCMIGLVQSIFTDLAVLRRFHMLTVNLITVVAPNHPLASMEDPIETQVLQKYVQLVLTDRSKMTVGKDYSVLSTQNWRLGDLSAKHSMLLEGLGWGNMPIHLVKDDIERGRLKVIRPIEFDARTAHLVMGGAYRSDRHLGPAAQWMINYLSEPRGLER